MNTIANKIQCYKLFPFLSMFYLTLLIVSVLLPYKLISIFGFVEPGGIFIFPLTYLLIGVITEGYGRAMALKMVYSSMFCLFTFNALVAIIIRIPSAPNTPNQEIFMPAFNHSIRLFTGCFVGLICSDLTNVYKMIKLKSLFHGKYFAQRCLWATALSEAIFNTVTYTITYFGMISIKVILKLIMYSWILKMVYSLIMILPLLWLMSVIKKIEGTEAQEINEVEKINPENLVKKFISAKERIAHSKNEAALHGHENQ